MTETKICKRCNKEKEVEDFRGTIGDREVGKFCSACRAYKNERYRKDYAAGYFKHYRQQREYRSVLFDKELPSDRKRCRLCLKPKPLVDFAVEHRYRARLVTGVSRYCLECRDYRKEWARDRRARMTAEHKFAFAVMRKRFRDGRKKQVIDAYGGKCVCCGVVELELLTIDHIVKIGSKKRKENGESGDRFYLKLIKAGFPSDYRCLCWNCNWSYGCYNYCPHQLHRGMAALIEMQSAFYEATEHTVRDLPATYAHA